MCRRGYDAREQARTCFSQPWKGLAVRRRSQLGGWFPCPSLVVAVERIRLTVCLPEPTVHPKRVLDMKLVSGPRYAPATGCTC